MLTCLGWGNECPQSQSRPGIGSCSASPAAYKISCSIAIQLMHCLAHTCCWSCKQASKMVCGSIRTSGPAKVLDTADTSKVHHWWQLCNVMQAPGWRMGAQCSGRLLRWSGNLPQLRWTYCRKPAATQEIFEFSCLPSCCHGLCNSTSCLLAPTRVRIKRASQ